MTKRQRSIHSLVSKPLLFAVVAATPMAGIAAQPVLKSPSVFSSVAYAAEIGASTTDWTATETNHQENAQSQNGYYSEVEASFSIPDSAVAGDTIDIVLPEHLRTAIGDKFPVYAEDGTSVIGNFATVNLQTYRITLTDYVDTHTDVTAKIKFKEYYSGNDTNWALNTPQSITFTVGGQLVDTGRHIVRVVKVQGNENSMLQQDVFGPGFYYLVGFVSDPNPAQIAPTLDGPYTVTMNAPEGTTWNCDYNNKGVPIDGYRYNADKSVTRIAQPKIVPTSCTDTTLTIDIPDITNEDGIQAEFVAWRPFLLLTQESIDTGRTDFNGTTTVVGTDPVTGAQKTINLTTEGNYNYSGGAGTGQWAPQISVETYIEDADTTAPTGKTTDGQDSDADAAPGILTMDTKPTVSIAIKNPGQVTLNNVQVTDSKGNVVGTVDSIAPGATTYISVDATVEGSVSGTAFAETYTATGSDANGKTASASDPVNSLVYAAPVAKLTMKAFIDNQDANEPVTLTPGKYATSYSITNPNEFDITVTELTGVDGKPVTLPENTVIKPGETLEVKGTEVTVAENAQVGGMAQTKGTAESGLPEMFNQPTISMTAEDPAYATGTELPAPVAEDDKATTKENTPVVIDILSNDKANGDGVTITKVELLDQDGNVVPEITTKEGTFVINDNKAIFTPADGFSGDVPPVTYRITDSNGKTDPATITVTVEKEAVVTPTPTPSETVTPTPTPEPKPSIDETPAPKPNVSTGGDPTSSAGLLSGMTALGAAALSLVGLRRRRTTN